MGGVSSIYICTSVYTGIPYFRKALVKPLHFYKRPTLIPVFANWKIQKGFSLLLKKKIEKQKYHSVFVLQRAICYQRQHTRKQQAWPRQPPSLQTTLSLSASSSHILNCVCEHLCSMSIYSVHLLASCILRHGKSLRKVIFWVWGSSKNFFHIN